MRILGGKILHALGEEVRDLRQPIEEQRDVQWQVHIVRADITISRKTRFVCADAQARDVVITLPNNMRGVPVVIKRIDDSSNAVNIVPTGSMTIDGSNRLTLTDRWAAVMLVADGERWYVVGKV